MQVRGQGAVTVGGTSFRCESADPRPDTVGATCRYVEDAPGAFERVFGATPAAAPAGNWVFGGWTGCPDTGGSPGECRIASPPGGAGARILVARFEDVRPPHVTLGDAAIGDHGAEFTFAADEPAAFSCRLDNARAPCTSPVAYALDEGRHVFGVRAIDAAGRRGESDELRFVVVDTTLTRGPPGDGSVQDATAAFGFASRAGTVFECRLDDRALSGAGDWSRCASPVAVAGLQEGAHRFSVRARAGPWIDPVPATVAWRVDRTPPDTVIAEGPDEGATTDVMPVVFRASSPDEPSSTRIECRLDSDPFVPCTDGVAVLTGLEPGIHVFLARARDAAGNLDPTPVRRTWNSAYVDRDGDGHGEARDCNDGNAAVHPGAVDDPADGIDQDCDGTYASDGSAAIDGDGDGVAAGTDCNDGNPAIRPGAFDDPADGIDQDCDGVYARPPDADGDGVRDALDCAPGRGDIHPGAVDRPGDGLDQDCSGADARLRAPASPSRAIATRLSFVALPAAGRTWRRSRVTRIVRLMLLAVPARSAVTIRCRGRERGCGATRLLRKPKGRLPLSGIVRRVRLRPRAVLTVDVVHPALTGRRWEIRARARRRPALSRRCLAPRSGGVVRC